MADGPPEPPAEAPVIDLSARFWQPRIVPSTRPSNRRLVLGMIIGLVAGLVLFGSGGFALARLTAKKPAAGRAAPTPSPTLPLYEQTQLAINQARFDPELAKFAHGWLPHVSSCARDTDRNGPRLQDGETARVVCYHGSATVYFVRYASTAERDKVRTRVLTQNVDARTLTTGVTIPDGGTPSASSTGAGSAGAGSAGAGPPGPGSLGAGTPSGTGGAGAPGTGAPGAGATGGAGATDAGAAGSQPATGPGNSAPATGVVAGDGPAVEYAFQSRGDDASRVVCGIWWESAQLPVAGYVLAYWAEGLSQRWEPLRDLWQRYR